MNLNFHRRWRRDAIHQRNNLVNGLVSYAKECGNKIDDLDKQIEEYERIIAEEKEKKKN